MISLLSAVSRWLPSFVGWQKRTARPADLIGVKTLHIVCFREPLREAWLKASEAAHKKEERLKGVLVTAEGDAVTLSATDMEVSLRAAVAGAEVLREGSCLLAADRMRMLLSEATDAKLDVETAEDNAVLIGSDSSNEWEFPGLPIDQFPKLEAEKQGKAAASATVTAGALDQLLARTAFATAGEGQRFAWQGVAFLCKDGGAPLTLVATDGKRMSIAGDTAAVPKPPVHVVPDKAVRLLRRLISDVGGGEEVSLSFRANAFTARVGGSVLTSRLVEGRYPDYRAGLNRKAVAKALVDGSVLLAAVRQAAVMTDKDTSRITFHFAGDLLTVNASSATQGCATARATVYFKSDDGGPVSIDMDPKLLTEFLKLAGDKEVRIDLPAAGDGAAVFRCGEDWLYLVAPMAGGES